MIEWLKSVNMYLADFDNIIGVFGIVVAIIGIIVGGIGIKQIRDANNLKFSKSRVSNSQVANTIHNSGISVEDTEYITKKIVDEKTKNKPDIYTSKEAPEKLKDGDIWFQVFDEDE